MNETVSWQKVLDGCGLSPPSLSTFLEGLREREPKKLEIALASTVTITIRSFGEVLSVTHLKGRADVLSFFKKMFPELGDYEIRLLEKTDVRAALEYGRKAINNPHSLLNYTLLIEFNERVVTRLAFTEQT